MTDGFYTVEDVMNICKISERSAYEIIRKFNKELNESGFYTVRGKVLKSYFEKRIGVLNSY